MQPGNTWDYIVIGAGSAGCVVANRLTESEGTRVLLLEAGGRDRNIYMRFPAGFVKIPPKYNWLYPAEPDPTRDNRVENWSAGKVTGGGSSINVTGWTRGHRADFDTWAAEGCPGWEYDKLLPYFRRSETFGGGGDKYRGDSGPMHVDYPKVKHPLVSAFMDAAEQCGHPYNPDLNGEIQEGVGYFQVSQRRGRRDSTARAYLAPALRRKNLKLRTDATVTRIIIDDGRAVGVEYRHGGKTFTARAQREVVLSAGAFGSPKILMLSGVGPAQQLTAQGIEVLVDSPGVGRNLQEHPFGSLLFRVNVRTLPMDLTPLRALKHGFNFVFRGRGAITASAAIAAIFAKFAPERSRPDLELLFMPAAIGRTSGKRASTVQDFGLIKEPIVMASAWLCHPTSRGTVMLRSSNPEEKPVIDHHVIGGPSDMDGLINGVRMLREIFRADALRPYVLEEVAPGSSVSSDEDLAAYLRASVHRGEHGSGTCKMGTDEMAVVDPELRVKGVEALRVVDASVMPSLIAGAINAATVMIAEKASDVIRGSGG